MTSSDDIWDQIYEDDNLPEVKADGSVIRHLISQIRIGMDLSRIVLPTFILETRSLLEMYADFFAHPDIFSTIPDQTNPEDRLIQLVKWYLSAFHAGRKSTVAKKPYNPILGEIFMCDWNVTPSEKLSFVAEQVSHHPPISAFYAENPSKSISCTAHIYTKSKYLGLSVGVENIGQATISLAKHNENYICTFPSAYGRSILTVPWIELGGSVKITCTETGYSADIQFLTKPFYGGKKHQINAQLVRPNQQTFMVIEGEWNGAMHYKSPPTSPASKVFVDTANMGIIKKNVRPVIKQESYESRNVWKHVTRALKAQDVSGATDAKFSIESKQRDQIKQRLEQGVSWKPRYFKEMNDTWVYTSPGKMTNC